MKTDVADLMLYGEWDDETDEYPENSTWFEKSSCQYFQTDSLMDEFGYESYEDIENCGYFIPVFRRSEQEIMRKFIVLYGDKSVSDRIQKIIDDEDEKFGAAFRIYAEVHPGFSDAYLKYENGVLEIDAKKWAEENGVAFFGDWDPDRKVNFDVLCRFFYYEDDSTPGFTHYWFSKKDYSEIDSSKKNKMIANGDLTQKEIDREYIIIPAVTKSEAEKKGKSWDDLVKEVAVNWCKENEIKWYVPTHKPDHIKTDRKS